MITKLQTNPLAEMRLVIPADSLHVQEPKDMAALHVAEHWLLEGFGDYRTADEAFGAAERLGGSLSGSTSRKFVQFKLSYFSKWHDEALAMLRQVLKSPRLDAEQLPAIIEEVTDELDNDSALTTLFEALYRDVFDDRYGWPDAGTPRLVRELKPDEVQRMAERLLKSKRFTFVASADGLPTVTNTSTYQFIQPKIKTGGLERSYTDAEASLGLMPLALEGNYRMGLALHWYLKASFQNMVAVRQHVLPGFILRAVSYDYGDVSEADIKEQIAAFRNLPEAELQHFLEVADCAMQEDLSNPEKANDRALNAWVYGNHLL